jgi:hypothetical protein
MREVPTNSGVCKADIIKLLRDRQWHPATELVQTLSARINPETACRIFVRKSGGNDEQAAKKRAELPDDVRVAMGKRKIIDGLIHGDPFETAYETDTATFEKRKMVRLVGWHCWSCGVKQNGTGHEDKHLCRECAEAIE